MKPEVRLSKWPLLWDLRVGLEFGMVKCKIWDVGEVLDTTLL